MSKWILLSVCWVFSASVCLAQFQQYPQTPMMAQPGAFAPNMYNRQTQPLSPYLNLLRGGDPGINYYYGVRPGLQSQGAMMGGMGQNNMMYPSQLQMGFLPTLQNSTDESIPLPKAGEPIQLRSSGHPITFNGIPPSYFGLNRYGLSTAGGNMNRQFGGGTNQQQQNQAPAAYNKKSTSKK